MNFLAAAGVSLSLIANLAAFLAIFLAKLLLPALPFLPFPTLPPLSPLDILLTALRVLAICLAECNFLIPLLSFTLLYFFLSYLSF